MNPISYYLTDLYQKSNGYRPTWLPNLPLHIGDYGVIENGVFTKEGNLNDININFQSEISSNDTNIDISSEKGISITTKVKGKIESKAVSLGKADAGFIIEFKNNNSFIFKLNGTKTTIISNLGVVKDEILNRYNEGKWKKETVVINELIEAKSATILLSGEAGSKIELKAEGNINVETIDIADASLNLKLTSGQALSAQIIGQEGITPLYRVIGIKKSWISTSVGGRGKGSIDNIIKENPVSEIEFNPSDLSY